MTGIVYVRSFVRSCRLNALVAAAFVLALPGMAGDVTFTFTYDSSFTTNAGANLAAAQNDFTFIGNYISSVVKTNGAFDKTIEVSVSGTNAPSSGTLASAGPLIFTAAAFNKGLPQAMIQDNFSFSGTAAEASVNFGASWGYGNVIGTGQFDFQYVLLHEMFHALGFISLIDSDGTSEFSNQLAYSYFDRYVQGYDGTAYTDFVIRTGNTPTGFMTNGVAALTNSANPLLFNGPNVVALLGGPAQLYTPSTWQPGSSVSHYNYPGLLEYYAVDTGDKNAAFGSLDLAFLRDIGYANVVPEPGSLLLAAIAAAGALLSRRYRPARKNAAHPA